MALAGRPSIVIPHLALDRRSHSMIRESKRSAPSQTTDTALDSRLLSARGGMGLSIDYAISQLGYCQQGRQYPARHYWHQPVELSMTYDI